MSGKQAQSSNQSSEEQIRQKIRAQLQQRLPSLAQQLPDSDRQSNDLDGGLQSFGGSGLPNSSDFFNSDSFRATNNSQDNRVIDSDPRRPQTYPQQPRDQSQNTKVVDLSHMQPFQQQYFGAGDELEDVDERKSEDEQSQQHRDPSHPDSIPQRQRRNATLNPDVEDTPEVPLEAEQPLSPLNYEEFVYQQQLIEELISENSTLKQDLQSAESKLKKVESQLTKTKQWIRDLGNIKEDIQTLNLKADQVEEYESLTTENEILKSKIQDLETRVNTLSRAGEDQRVDDKGRFERIIQTITDENRLVTEKYRMCQQAMMKQDEEIIKWKSLSQQRDQEIVILHSNWKQLHEDFSNSVKEYKVLQQHNDELRNMARNQTKNEQAMKNQFRARNEPRSDHSSQRDESQNASLRNRSMSGDKKAAGAWIVQEKEYSDRDHQIHARSANVSQDESALHIEYNDKKNIQSAVFNMNKQGQQTQAQQQTFQNNINVKNYQPIQITIASPSEQTLALAERCQKLEEYCRELIRTNKILDCENRLAIAQILNLTDPRNQLQNLTAAMSFIGNSGKIYDKKSLGANKFVGATFNRKNSHQNKENQAYRQNGMSGFQKEMSLRNLNALRQVGAPPISNVFQNNNSSFIVEKFNGMLQSESGRLGDSQTLGRSNIGRNANNHKYLIPYLSSNTQQSKPSSRDLHNLDGGVHGHQTINTGTFSNQDKPSGQLQKVSTAVHLMQPPVIETRPRVNPSSSALDLHLNELKNEIEEKSGIRLHLNKVTEGYYQLNDQIVNLKLDEDNTRILIRVQTDDQDANSHTANIRDQVSKITSSVFVDFIDFLIQQGYISIDGDRGRE